MAEVVSEFPRRTRRHNAIYPWEQWLNGQVWKIVSGVDFHCSYSGFRCAISSYCGHHGFDYSTQSTDGGKTIYLQATRKETAK